MPPFKDQLDDVSDYQENKEKDQDNIDINEAKNENTIGNRQDSFLAGEMTFKKSQDDNHADGD